MIDKNLSISQALLEGILDAASSAIICIDQDQRIILFNRLAEHIFGYQAQEVINQPLDTLLPERYRQKHRQQISLFASQQTAWRGMYERGVLVGKRASGEEFPIEVSISKTEVEGQMFFTAILNDVSSRVKIEQELQESEAKFRTLAEMTTSAIALFRVSPEGSRLEIIYANPAAERITGYSLDELPLINAWDLVHPDFREMVKQRAAARLRNLDVPPNYEVKLLTKHNKECWVDLNAKKMEYRGRDAILVTAFDITRHKEAEEAEHQHRILAEALRDAAATVTSTLDIDEVLDRILADVGQVVPHDAAGIILIQGNKASVVRIRGSAPGASSEMLSRAVFDLDKTPILNELARSNHPIIVPDFHTYPGRQDRAEFRWVRAFMGAPIRLGGEIIGFLTLTSTTPEFFTPAHADRLQAFTNQTAIAIRNAQLYEQAQAVAAMEERQRLARDLHDAVSQTLFSANVITEMLPRIWAHSPDEIPQRLNQLHRLTQGALAEMRALLLELRPAALQDAEIGDLLRYLTDALVGRKEIAVDLLTDCQQPLPPEVKVAFYRIAQEALNNVDKHAQASRVEVNLRVDDHGAELRISDNGDGFDERSLPSDRLGLSIMRERAEGIGAACQIISIIGYGTEVRVLWPDVDTEEAGSTREKDG